MPDLTQYMWIGWLALAVVFIIIELVTLEFTFLMLAAGSLTVVATPYHGMSVGSIESLRSLPIGPVQHVEGEFGDLRDVAPERQGSGSGRHDLICRDIIAYLQ